MTKHRFKIIAGAVALLSIVFNTISFAAEDPKAANRNQSSSKILGDRDTVYQILNINNITTWMRRDGYQNHSPAGMDGVFFPRGTKQVIYQDNSVWGGKTYLNSTHTTPSSQLIRVGGGTYNIGTQAGRITGSGATAVATLQSSPEIRIWRIRRDYARMSDAELARDAAESNEIPISQVTPAQKQRVFDLYAADWANWPVAFGAPYIERNGTPGFQPPPTFGPNFTVDSLISGKHDEPGIAGINTYFPADQIVWTVYNDLDSVRTNYLYGSNPMGLEVQVTVWGYKRTDAMGNLYFKRTRLINKGGVDIGGGAKGSHWIDSMYISQWSDPDVGAFGDDLAGCDTTLSLGFAYNGQASDQEFIKLGLPPPSIGYAFLQGPIVPGLPGDIATFNMRKKTGFRNLPLTSFAYFGAGSGISGPPFTREGGLRWWKLLQGYVPDASTRPWTLYPSGPFPPSKFPLSGDPVTGTGFLDGKETTWSFPPGDRNIVLSTGPFKMAPGDTQEVIVGTIGGIGSDYLSSVAVMKQTTRIARSVMSGLFASIPPRFETPVTYPTALQATIRIRGDARGLGLQSFSSILKRRDGTVVTTVQMYDDGTHGDSVPNDGIWNNSITVTREGSALYLNASVINSGGQAMVWDNVPDSITIAGPLQLSNFRIFADNINNNGQANPGENIRYGFTVPNTTAFPLTAVTISPEKEYESKSRTIASLPVGFPDSMVYNPGNPESYFSVNIPANFAGSAFRFAVHIRDTSSNVWIDSLAIAVLPFARPLQTSVVTRTAGLTDWKFDVRVVDPSAVSNRNYEITIVDSINAQREKGFNLKDIADGRFILSNHPLPDELAHNIPVTSGFKIRRGENWDVVGLRRDSTRWISSWPVWFQGFRFVLDTVSAFNGGVTSGSQLGIMHFTSFNTSFAPDSSYTVEVRFDSTNPQKAYRLRRTGLGTEYLIQSPNPFVNVPFSVWDVRSPSSPRQLTVAWQDQDNNGTWNPPVGTDGLEIVFIYDQTYDPTGNQFRYPEAPTNTGTAINNECTIGPKANIMYALSLGVRSGYQLNQHPGTLYIKPWHGLTRNDRFTFNPTVVVEPELPSSYSLSQNYPNPFNPSTTVQYSLPVSSNVTIRVFNLLGQEIRVLVKEEKEAGTHQVVWDGMNNSGRRVASGVYFYHLEAGPFTQSRKMLLIK